MEDRSSNLRFGGIVIVINAATIIVVVNWAPNIAMSRYHSLVKLAHLLLLFFFSFFLLSVATGAVAVSVQGGILV
jgi:hypothetical protein